MAALATGFGCTARVYQNDHTTGTFSLVREALNQIAPSGIQNTLCEMTMHHARDGEIFKRDTVVAVREIMRQLVQEVFALVADMFVLVLEDRNRFTAILSALCPTCHPPLGNPQLPLGRAIESRMVDLLTVAGGDQACQP